MSGFCPAHTIAFGFLCDLHALGCQGKGSYIRDLPCLHSWGLGRYTRHDLLLQRGMGRQSGYEVMATRGFHDLHSLFHALIE